MYISIKVSIIDGHINDESYCHDVKKTGIHLTQFENFQVQIEHPILVALACFIIISLYLK